MFNVTHKTEGFALEFRVYAPDADRSIDYASLPLQTRFDSEDIMSLPHS
jgi:hypothetical protein